MSVRTVEIAPIEGQTRGIAVAHHDDGSVGLHMYWPVAVLQEANDWSPEHGNMIRGARYLTPDQRRALALVLLEGLDG